MPRPAGIASAPAPAESSVVAVFRRHARSFAKPVLLLAAAGLLIGGRWPTGDHPASNRNPGAPSIAPMKVMKAVGPLPETKIADYV